ncbi:fumarylacetoacetate hydrolase family protein [bacterium]|nr:fumarylacetoacetate hydrolase family protein [bacterium]
MRIGSIRSNGTSQAAVSVGGGWKTIAGLNVRYRTNLPCTVDGLIRSGRADELRHLLHQTPEKGETVIHDEAVFLAPYLNPPKIWGIGLNFPKHADDLQARLPTDEPASFMKPATAIIGPGDRIMLPPQSQRVTGEAEIGVIIGKECKNVGIEDVQDVIFGYTTIIDMTAEDILRKNPRFLTRAKSFDTFFSFGPWIVTADEIADVGELTITTWINGKEHISNQVKNMTFPPFELVSFHSRVMTLKPGDIISCGTPGAVPLRPGDLIGCTVDGIGKLENPVANSKKATAIQN